MVRHMCDCFIIIMHGSLRAGDVLYCYIYEGLRNILVFILNTVAEFPSLVSFIRKSSFPPDRVCVVGVVITTLLVWVIILLLMWLVGGNDYRRIFLKRQFLAPETLERGQYWKTKDLLPY